MEDIIIRGAMPEDAEALLAVYAPYVPETAITFEYEVPAAAEFVSRIERTLQRYPYLVAVSDGEILGYAYLSPLGERKAYEHAAETSVYLRRDVRGRGLGKRLYQRLEEIAAAQRITRLYACIAYAAEEDERRMPARASMSAQGTRRSGISTGAVISSAAAMMSSGWRRCWQRVRRTGHSSRIRSFRLRVSDLREIAGAVLSRI